MKRRTWVRVGVCVCDKTCESKLHLHFCRLYFTDANSIPVRPTLHAIALVIFALNYRSKVSQRLQLFGKKCFIEKVELIIIQNLSNWGIYSLKRYFLATKWDRNTICVFLKSVHVQNVHLLPQYTPNNYVKQSDVPSGLCVFHWQPTALLRASGSAQGG